LIPAVWVAHRQVSSFVATIAKIICKAIQTHLLPIAF